MKVIAIICPNCNDTIFSRARHDFHWCSCKEVAIDGGFDYVRTSFKNYLPQKIELEINVTKQELYDDWNQRIDKFGIIKKS